MKLTLTIEFDGDAPPRVAVQTPRAWRAPETPRTPEPVAAPHAASPGTPANGVAAATAAPDREYDSGRRLVPIVTALRRMPTPFTRAALAAELGCDRPAATAHLNRLQKRGWVESPAHGLWRTTKQFTADNA